MRQRHHNFDRPEAAAGFYVASRIEKVKTIDQGLLLIGLVLGLVFAFVLALPDMTWAAYQDNDSKTIVNCQQQMQSNAIQHVQVQTIAASNVFSNSPNITSIGYSCVANIRTLFSSNLSGFSSFGSIEAALVTAAEKIIYQLIVSELNSLCAQAYSMVTPYINDAQSILNKICIPLPNYGLTGSPSLNGKLSCYGVTLASINGVGGPTQSNSTTPSAGAWGLWSGGSGSTGTSFSVPVPAFSPSSPPIPGNSP